MVKPASSSCCLMVLSSYTLSCTGWLFIPAQRTRAEHLPVPSSLRRGWLHHTSGYRLPHSRQHLSWTQPQKGAVQIHVWYLKSYYYYNLQSTRHHKGTFSRLEVLYSRVPSLLSESSPAVSVLPGTGPDRHVPTEQQQPVPGVLQEPPARVSAERLVCVAVNR